jgi:hypothetical protein
MVTHDPAGAFRPGRGDRRRDQGVGRAHFSWTPASESSAPSLRSGLFTGLLPPGTMARGSSMLFSLPPLDACRR